MKGVDIVAPRRQDGAVAIALRVDAGHIKLVDFVMRIDIAQLHAMP